MKEEAEEIDYLVWFRQMADFGPATGDVIAYMDKQFEEETGKRVPLNWRDEEEE